MMVYYRSADAQFSHIDNREDWKPWLYEHPPRPTVFRNLEFHIAGRVYRDPTDEFYEAFEKALTWQALKSVDK